MYPSKVVESHVRFVQNSFQLMDSEMMRHYFLNCRSILKTSVLSPRKQIFSDSNKCVKIHFSNIYSLHFQKGIMSTIISYFDLEGPFHLCDSDPDLLNNHIA